MWAGGPIDWNAADIRNVGYFYAQIGEVSMKCYNANSPPGTNLHTSYYYNNVRGTNDTVVDSDKSTIIASFSATGTDMDAGKVKGSESSTSAKPSSTAASVPGGGNGKPGTKPSSTDPSNTDTKTDPGTSSDSGKCGVDGFSQWCDANGSPIKGQSAGSRPEKKVFGASAFAVVVALAGLLLL